jgi:hypothetical protein
VGECPDDRCGCSGINILQGGYRCDMLRYERKIQKNPQKKFTVPYVDISRKIAYNKGA